MNYSSQKQNCYLSQQNSKALCSYDAGNILKIAVPWSRVHKYTLAYPHGTYFKRDTHPYMIESPHLGIQGGPRDQPRSLQGC